MPLPAEAQRRGSGVNGGAGLPEWEQTCSQWALRGTNACVVQHPASLRVRVTSANPLLAL
jgi:hypothetical protein